MPEIVISTSSFDIDDNPAIARLEAAGLEIVLNPFGRKLTEEEIGTLLTDSVVGLLAGVEPLTDDVLSSSPALRVISRCGVGVDNIDQGAARERNILIYSTPGAPVDAVVEMTLGLMLATLRQIPAADRALRNGKWPRHKGVLLKSSVVGILGLGRIGFRVAELCARTGARVIGHDPVVRQTPEAVEWVDLDTLVSEAGLISLHIPYNDATHHLVDSTMLGRMKRGCILVNTARGGLIDETALVRALESGQIGAAGIDVFETEPYRGPLRRFEQVVLTPHLASSAVESRREMELEAAENLVQGLEEAGVLSDGSIV